MGYREDERERALQEVPFYRAAPETWPDGVRGIGMDELDNLGIDRNAVLHWNGHVISIEKRLSLTFWQKASAIVFSIAAMLVSISTIVQGIAAYSSWACTVGWPGICP
ncbi:hypothetical protein [Sinorhizobium medicae]|uniref:hypothetical protein n=1 Tax=Sinorhizobium medicae TaxID=110321 RepID=UPI000FDBF20A|nr:hypothetical protein [Sinorhizobium medicae]RVJ06263.1 hypothetical protein CN181_19350 [Sinorhizobium medicae]